MTAKPIQRELELESFIALSGVDLIEVRQTYGPEERFFSVTLDGDTFPRYITHVDPSYEE